MPAVAALFVPPAHAGSPNDMPCGHWDGRDTRFLRVDRRASRWSPFREVGCHCLVAGKPADLINRRGGFTISPSWRWATPSPCPRTSWAAPFDSWPTTSASATVSFFSNDAGFLSFPVQ